MTAQPLPHAFAQPVLLAPSAQPLPHTFAQPVLPAPSAAQPLLLPWLALPHIEPAVALTADGTPLSSALPASSWMAPAAAMCPHPSSGVHGIASSAVHGAASSAVHGAASSAIHGAASPAAHDAGSTAAHVAGSSAMHGAAPLATWDAAAPRACGFRPGWIDPATAAPVAAANAGGTPGLARIALRLAGSMDSTTTTHAAALSPILSEDLDEMEVEVEAEDDDEEEVLEVADIDELEALASGVLSATEGGAVLMEAHEGAAVSGGESRLESQPPATACRGAVPGASEPTVVQGAAAASAARGNAYLGSNYLAVEDGGNGTAPRPRLWAEDHPASACNDARVLADSLALLTARFPTCRDLLGKLTRASASVQCHAAMAVVRVPPHRLLVIREAERVVAACLVVHVPAPRRHGPEHTFSEVLLFAVDKTEERRGLGHALVAYTKLCSARAGSDRVLIMSNRNGFWHDRAFGFREARPDDPVGLGIGRRRFDPWSQACELLLGGLGGSSSAQHEAATRASFGRIRMPSVPAVAPVRGRRGGGWGHGGGGGRGQGGGGGRGLGGGGRGQGGGGSVQSHCAARPTASATARAGGGGGGAADRACHQMPRHHAPPPEKLSAPAAASGGAPHAADDEEEEDDDVVEVGCSEWVKVPLRCAVSLQRLADPARGTGCHHPPRCNYTELRDVAMRSKACPVMGCNAKMQRTHDVVRDDALREQLRKLPKRVEAVWIGADGAMRTMPPPPPAPPGALSSSGVASADLTSRQPVGRSSTPTLSTPRKRCREQEDAMPIVHDHASSPPEDGERGRRVGRRRNSVIAVDGA